MTNPGRGAWNSRGFPQNGTGFYQLLNPINIGSNPAIDQDHRAVNFGVQAIQTRINELSVFSSAIHPLVADGWLGPLTAAGILWAQQHLGIVVDGQAGPHTMEALLWPVIEGYPNAKIIGGICAHESAFDPGAVGSLDADDIGLVQINGPANPHMTEADRFDYHKAFQFCSDRIDAAMATYHNLSYAIAAYANPGWAVQWAKLGIAPNPQAVAFVNFVRNWKP